MSNERRRQGPRGPMGHGMRGNGEKAKNFKGTLKKLFVYLKPYYFKRTYFFRLYPNFGQKVFSSW